MILMCAAFGLHIECAGFGLRRTDTPPESGSCFATAPTPFAVWSQPVMRSQRNNVLAICLNFKAARSPSGAAAGGSSWVGKIDGEDTCGVSPKVFAGFVGAAGDAGRFFLGFRPRLLGMVCGRFGMHELT
jgi:hypothetical protein